MMNKFYDIAFTPSVKQARKRYGWRRRFEKIEDKLETDIEKLKVEKNENTKKIHKFCIHLISRIFYVNADVVCYSFDKYRF